MIGCDSNMQIGAYYGIARVTYEHGGVVFSAESIPQQPCENRVPIGQAFESLAST